MKWNKERTPIYLKPLSLEDARVGRGSLSRIFTVSEPALPFKNITPSRSTEQAPEGSKVPLRSWLLLFVLAITEFLTFASITVLSPFFPTQAEKKGASASAYGVIIGIFELAALIISPLCIKMVLKLCPKVILLTGIILLGSGTGLFALTMRLPPGTPFVVVCILLRVVQGIGAGVIDVCSYMVVSLKIPQRVSLAIGILEMAVGFGITAGPAIGGVLFDQGGFAVPFLVLSCLIFATLPGNYFLFPEIENQATDKRFSYLMFFFNCEILVGIVSITSGGATLGFLTGLLEPHLRAFQLSTTSVGFITILTGVMFATTTPLWGHLSDNSNKKYTLLCIGCLITAAGFLMLGPIPWIHTKPKLWLMLLALGLCGLGSAAQSICPFALMLFGTKRLEFMDALTTSALVSAVHITCSTAGNSLGPIVGGFFVETVGFRMFCFLMAVFSMLQIVLHLSSWYFTKRIAISSKNISTDMLIME